MRAFAYVLFAAAFLGCSKDNAGTESGTAAITDSFSLAGFSETLLVGDSAGKYALVHLGEATTVTPVSGTTPGYPVAGRSADGKFRTLVSDGSLWAIDPTNGALTQTGRVAIDEPSDLEIETDGALWVSGNGLVERVAPDGTVSATLAIEGNARGITRVGDRLFVQVQRANGGRPRAGAVAIIDLPSRQIVKTIELLPRGEAGLNPDGPMIVDEVHHKLLLTAHGERPSNTGLVARIDLDRLDLDPWFFRAGSGFQGGLAFGTSSDELYVAYHTSTPVTSTHLFHFGIDDAGEIVTSNRTILDAFEEIDVYPMNRTHTLFALPVTCLLGFCVGGKGVSFIEAKTGTVHPRLTAETIGLVPSLAVFL